MASEPNSKSLDPKSNTSDKSSAIVGGLPETETELSRRTEGLSLKTEVIRQYGKASGARRLTVVSPTEVSGHGRFAVPKEAKGPAEAATSPSHGSTNPQKDTEMNSPETTTTLSGTPAPAGREAMPKGPSPEYYAAWAKCRDLGKQLSQALAATGDEEYAFIRPAGVDFAVLFGTRQDEVSASLHVGTPIDRVERLTWQLSVALDEWNGQTNVPYMAHVPPASSGNTTWFENTARDEELFKRDAARRLSTLLGMAGAIIRDNPDLMIETINVSQHGVHTIRKAPGVPKNGEAL